MNRTITCATTLALLALCSCKPEPGTSDADADQDADQDREHDADPDEGDGNDDSGVECDDATDCDDGEACTDDLCGVGNVCRHITFDDRCPDDRVCREGRGCVDPTQCEVPADCDDGSFCTGAERCVGGTCFAGEPEDCDDNDDCTTDSCNIATDRCVHDPAPGCVPDGGPDADVEPFDPELHYGGTFDFLPSPSSSCGLATFNISTVTITSSADELRIQAGAFPLVQNPRPSGESFDVTYRQPSCGDYRLAGSFTNSDIFTGRWTASFFGGCGACGSQDLAVTGVRQ